MGNWGAGTEAEQATWAANAEKMMKAWETDKDALEAEITATFNAAATGENGVVNEAQYVDLCQKVDANYDAKGWVMPHNTEAQMKKGYAIINKLTPGVDGVSLNDYWNSLMK